MNLQERLDAAREQRRLAAGLPPSRPATVQVDPPEPDEPLGVQTAGPAGGIILDLRPADPVVDLRPLDGDEPGPFQAAQLPDRPTVCANCGGSVRLDLEDRVGGLDHLSCTECGTMFQVPR